jgi:hypothetical protein
MRASPTRVAAVALLAAAAAVTSGCSLQLRAVQLKIEVDAGSMRLISPVSGIFHGGETVITIVNTTSERRQFTLAQTALPPARLTTSLLDAFSYRDNSEVVDVTGVMRGSKVQLVFGAIPQAVPTQTRLHVYLRAGEPYLLFDRLGGYKSGLALRIEARPS